MLDNALEMINEISNSGFKAYIVGGFVRDHILGIKSNDIDITTNATPKDIREIFKDDCLPGEDYGSVVVVRKNYRYEITTFRKDIGYVGNRRPSEIEYIDSLEEDLLRRDFTINTICMDKDGKIVDHLNGIEDLKKRIIRSVGNADKKFSEDALRILRAIRFATILNFKLDDEIVKAINNNRELLMKLSYNRKKEELDKIFTSSHSKNGVIMILKFKLDKELEIENLEKVKCFSSSISIWSVLNCSDKYPFSSNERDIIDNVNVVMKKNNLDPMNLYSYGLYVNSIAGEIKGINPKKITKAYVNLPIKRRKEIDIEADKIAELLNKEPGGYLKTIFEDLEKEIIYRRLPNKSDRIMKYIKNKYGGKEVIK